MKRILKFVSFVILPITVLILFVIIGQTKEQVIRVQEGLKPTMSGSISAIAWTYRGIFAMILIIIFSFVLYSRLSKIVKISVSMLMIILNLPVMCFMELAIYLPLGLIIMPLVNLIALTPAFVAKVYQQK